jgi:hypothetical protein
MENLDFRFSGSAKAVKITALTLPKPFLRESKTECELIDRGVAFP